ncbi:MAG: endonuclease/exonuclease/phosphatase family protein [Rhodospirillales bacterium]|jgi:endonuclease/exonuclease/phosphatase (EEP) superfamily protein YafD|nr:endonuclease/exonuclease/phosphatase family protein [Rhodospirillales bacterium]
MPEPRLDAPPAERQVMTLITLLQRCRLLPARLLPRQRLLALLPWAPVLGLAGAALVRLFDLHFWPVELLWHFTGIFFRAGLALTAFLLVVHSFVPAAAAAVLTIYFGLAASNVPGVPPGEASLLWVAHAQPAEGEAAETVSLRFVTHNLYVHNDRPDALADWLRQQDADVIVFQETSATTAAVMAAAKERYPHQFFAWPANYVERPDLRPWLNGLAILSRYPLRNPSVFRQTRYGAPVAFADLLLPGAASVRLGVVHTSNPVRRSGLRSRNQLMAALADELRRYDGTLIVAGDFNATPYTPAFARFLDDARLTTVRAYPGTYPQIAGDFGLPIDHVLVRGIRIAEIEALDAFGSDHRPLRADLVVPSAPTGSSG